LPKDRVLYLFERLYIVVALIYFSNGLFPKDISENDPSVRGQFDPVSLLTQLGIFAVLVFLVLVHRRTFADGLKRAGWLIPLCACVVFSSAWSLDPFFTFRRSIILVFTTLFAVYLASRFDWRQQLDLFAWSTILTIVGSFAIVAVLPNYGISHDIHAGDWRGVFLHKNVLGQQMVFGILVLLTGAPRILATWMRFALLALAGVLLIMSHSMTSILALAAVVISYPVLLLLRRPAKQIAWTATFLLAPLTIAVAGFLYSRPREIVLALGRSGSLTGRVPLWFAVAKSITHHPWLGYGFASFFNDLNPESRVVALRAKWFAEHAHNGYLDILLDIGIIGFAIFSIGFLITLWRAGKSFRFSENVSQRWPLLFLLFIAIYNCAESDLMRITAFFWIPYVSTFISLAMAKPFELPELVPEPEDPSGERQRHRMLLFDSKKRTKSPGDGLVRPRNKPTRNRLYWERHYVSHC